MTREREVLPETCPQCGHKETVESYGECPIYPAPQRPPLDLLVAVLVCRDCGHVQVRQVA